MSKSKSTFKLFNCKPFIGSAHKMQGVNFSEHHWNNNWHCVLLPCQKQTFRICSQSDLDSQWQIWCCITDALELLYGCEFGGLNRTWSEQKFEPENEPKLQYVKIKKNVFIIQKTIARATCKEMLFQCLCHENYNNKRIEFESSVQPKRTLYRKEKK